MNKKAINISMSAGGRLLLLIWIAFTAFSINAPAQADEDRLPCKEMFRQALRSMDRLRRAPSADSVVVLRYIQRSYRGGRIDSLTVDYRCSAAAVYCRTGWLDHYREGEASLLLNPRLKTMYLRNAAPEQQSALQTPALPDEAILDSLLAYSSVRICAGEDGPGAGEAQTIALRVASEQVSRFHTASISVTFKTSDRRLLSLRIDYPDRSAVELEFRRLQVLPAGSDGGPALASIVRLPEGRLQPAYRDYRLIDLRGRRAAASSRD